MIEEIQYNSLRPFRNHEVPEVINRLLEVPYLDLLLSFIFGKDATEKVKEQLKTYKSIEDFQAGLIYSVLQVILKKSVDSFTYAGLDQVDANDAFLFISNHRDIVLDPALTNLALHEKGFRTAEVAIGDNLLTEKWIEDIVKLNKSFIVRRNLQGRELVEASRLLSSYIKYSLQQNRHSVWIAQREGRAKDGNDKTQQGLINMLGMSAEGKSLKEHYASLNIIPIAISYEKDPCDLEKIKAVYAKRKGLSYIKPPGEDNESMKKGILGSKGKLHIQFCKPVRKEIESLPDSLKRNELCENICEIIDRQIISAYRLNTHNFMAYDLLMERMPDFTRYNEENLRQYKHEVDQKAALIEGNQEELRKLIYEISANPLINKEKLKTHSTSL
ncbi:MAG: 1-acyl-sn-glycerol-3-phosphate acyltransferase [Cyclobacteriaceae bacterium]|nr:1-acyl-sn-glycerol-3-phosphate acyltransferase [Cyclobacteriaceae bacterium]